MVLLGGVWFYSGEGACMVLFGGCVVLFGGACMVFPGGMHGFSGGVCVGGMVFSVFSDTMRYGQ